VKYKIDESGVLYEGTDTKQNGTHVSESGDLLKIFFKTYDVNGCVAFSDQENSIKNADLKSIGFESHIPYDPPVHQFLSHNDNCVYGSAKVKWPSILNDFKDDIEMCLTLLNLLDREIVKNSAVWFKQNMIDLNSESVITLIKDGAGNDLEYHKDCIYKYRGFTKQDARGPQPSGSRYLDDIICVSSKILDTIFKN